MLSYFPYVMDTGPPKHACSLIRRRQIVAIKHGYTQSACLSPVSTLHRHMAYPILSPIRSTEICPDE